MTDSEMQQSVDRFMAIIDWSLLVVSACCALGLTYWSDGWPGVAGGGLALLVAIVFEMALEQRRKERAR